LKDSALNSATSEKCTCNGKEEKCQVWNRTKWFKKRLNRPRVSPPAIRKRDGNQDQRHTTVP